MRQFDILRNIDLQRPLGPRNAIQDNVLVQGKRTPFTFEHMGTNTITENQRMARFDDHDHVW